MLYICLLVLTLNKSLNVHVHYEEKKKKFCLKLFFFFTSIIKQNDILKDLLYIRTMSKYWFQNNLINIIEFEILAEFHMQWLWLLIEENQETSTHSGFVTFKSSKVMLFENDKKINKQITLFCRQKILHGTNTFKMENCDALLIRDAIFPHTIK